MKKYYIEPELEVVVCRVNTELLIASLTPTDDPQEIVPDPTPYEEEFSGHEFNFDDDYGFDEEF